MRIGTAQRKCPVTHPCTPIVVVERTFRIVELHRCSGGGVDIAVSATQVRHTSKHDPTNTRRAYVSKVRRVPPCVQLVVHGAIAACQRSMNSPCACHITIQRTTLRRAFRIRFGVGHCSRNHHLLAVNERQRWHRCCDTTGSGRWVGRVGWCGGWGPCWYVSIAFVCGGCSRCGGRIRQQ
jgi:hypothetical protein